MGCVIARIIDPQIDIHLPYMNQGENAFSGRMLDERVVNPFFNKYKIPCSKSPYLSALRRNISLVPETEKGIRDKKAFSSLLEFVSILKKTDKKESKLYLRYLLYNFLQLQEKSEILVSKVKRLSLLQQKHLIHTLLSTPSGGAFPVFVGVAVFQTLKENFNLKWNIKWQGINVSDKAKGVGGDITIIKNKKAILAIEVTERPLTHSRVISTFNTKIGPGKIGDFLFFLTSRNIDEEILETTQQYFRQGHEINLINLEDWAINVLSTVGPEGRAKFTDKMVDLLESEDSTFDQKQKWNKIVEEIIST